MFYVQMLEDYHTTKKTIVQKHYKYKRQSI